MSEFGAKFIQFTNMSPIFKGASVFLVGLLALSFAWWMKKKWQEPLAGGLLFFIGLAVFITLYGLLLLLFRPNWWSLPY